MKYRVIIEVGYCEAFFDFDTPEGACAFATKALLHQVDSEDTKRKSRISMELVNTTKEEEEKSD